MHVYLFALHIIDILIKLAYVTMKKEPGATHNPAPHTPLQLHNRHLERQHPYQTIRFRSSEHLELHRGVDLRRYGLRAELHDDLPCLRIRTWPEGVASQARILLSDEITLPLCFFWNLRFSHAPFLLPIFNTSSRLADIWRFYKLPLVLTS